jgi:hypothetical protein
MPASLIYFPDSSFVTLISCRFPDLSSLIFSWTE